MSESATDPLVADLFSDHAAGEAALTKILEMAPQLSDAGVTGVLSIAKEGDGKITAGRSTCRVPRTSPRNEKRAGDDFLLRAADRSLAGFLTRACVCAVGTRTGLAATPT
jgi:hypothetical protein